jgi:uncharacterized repeat protein (TIGR04138 family)
MDDPLRTLALEDGRYSPEAFRFLFESLETAVRLAGKENVEGPDRHVTGQEVLVGLRELAQRSFGPLAAQVWRSWNVHTSMDWGRIVFLLVDNGLLNRRDSDTVEDFREGFDFDEVFVAGYEPEVPQLPEAGGDA